MLEGLVVPWNDDAVEGMNPRLGLPVHRRVPRRHHRRAVILFPAQQQCVAADENRAPGCLEDEREVVRGMARCGHDGDPGRQFDIFEPFRPVQGAPAGLIPEHLLDSEHFPNKLGIEVSGGQLGIERGDLLRLGLIVAVQHLVDFAGPLAIARRAENARAGEQDVIVRVIDMRVGVEDQRHIFGLHAMGGQRSRQRAGVMAHPRVDHRDLASAPRKHRRRARGAAADQHTHTPRIADTGE